MRIQYKAHLQMLNYKINELLNGESLHPLRPRGRTPTNTKRVYNVVVLTSVLKYNANSRRI